MAWLRCYLGAFRIASLAAGDVVLYSAMSGGGVTQVLFRCSPHCFARYGVVITHTPPLSYLKFAGLNNSKKG